MCEELPQHFSAIKIGIKTAEIRNNDRAYQVGDILILVEYDPKTKVILESNPIRVEVTHIVDLSDMQQLKLLDPDNDWVILSFKKL